eukprot:467904_1
MSALSYVNQLINCFETTTTNIHSSDELREPNKHITHETIDDDRMNQSLIWILENVVNNQRYEYESNKLDVYCLNTSKGKNLWVACNVHGFINQCPEYAFDVAISAQPFKGYTNYFEFKHDFYNSANEDFYEVLFYWCSDCAISCIQICCASTRYHVYQELKSYMISEIEFTSEMVDIIAEYYDYNLISSIKNHSEYECKMNQSFILSSKQPHSDTDNVHHDETDWNVHQLVDGYIRQIEQKMDYHSAMPLEIIEILTIFYKQILVSINCGLTVENNYTFTDKLFLNNTFKALYFTPTSVQRDIMNKSFQEPSQDIHIKQLLANSKISTALCLFSVLKIMVQNAKKFKTSNQWLLH